MCGMENIGLVQWGYPYRAVCTWQVPMRQSQIIFNAVSGSGNTVNQMKASIVTHMQERTHKIPDVLFSSHFYRDAAHPSRDSSKTPRRFALGACNVYLVGKTRRAPSRMRRYTVLRLQSVMHYMSTPGIPHSRA